MAPGLEGADGVEGDPVNALLEVAGAERAGLVVVGASARGGAKPLALGAVSRAVERVGRPVAVPGGTLRSGSSAVVAMPGTRGRFRTTDQRSNG